MIQQRTFGIGIVAIAICFAVTSTLKAQCDCGGCGSETTVDGSVYDSSPSSFMQNVGTFQSSPDDGCVENCCERSSCPVVCCGPYVSAFGGWSSISEFFREQALVDPETEERQFNFDDDFAYGLAVGRQVHQNARAEVEMTRRDTDFNAFQVQTFDSGALTTSVFSPAVGSLESYSLMVNLLYDFSPRSWNMVNLYGGAGAGIMDFDGDATTATNSYEIDDTAFAFQIIGGINKTITKRMDIFAEYRYVVADDVNVFDVTAGSSLGDFRYKSNDVFVGVRLRR